MSEVASYAEKAYSDAINSVAGPPAPDRLAVQEASGFDSDKERWMKYWLWDWRLRFGLKLILFLFVVVINIYWAHQVTMMLWKAGSSNSGFHLDNSVQIALVSTSIANFLALVIVVAKHLFPSKSS
ncbi:MAG: hypothetical protein WAK20_14755 [Candidatus Acidiferrum sp.]